MTRILNRPVALHELTGYILTRGLWLTCLQLLSAMALLLGAGDGAEARWLSGWYADYLQTMAAVTFGVTLVGSLLLEDVLRRVSP